MRGRRRAPRGSHQFGLRRRGRPGQGTAGQGDPHRAPDWHARLRPEQRRFLQRGWPGGWHFLADSCVYLARGRAQRRRPQGGGVVAERSDRVRSSRLRPGEGARHQLRGDDGQRGGPHDLGLPRLRGRRPRRGRHRDLLRVRARSATLRSGCRERRVGGQVAGRGQGRALRRRQPRHRVTHGQHVGIQRCVRRAVRPLRHPAGRRPRGGHRSCCTDGDDAGSSRPALRGDHGLRWPRRAGVRRARAQTT